MSKLIIIRGNSGSGKSTLAKELRKRLSSQKTALVEQDYLRRHVLGETGKGGDENVELIEQVTIFALRRNYLTIVEGIMPAEYYRFMLERLNNINAGNTYIFYLDVSLKETIQRHSSKPNRDDFGESELREWYRENDLLRISNETIIPENLSQEESIKFILKVINEK